MAITKFTVSRDDSIYQAWPSLVRTASGKLICVFSECEDHLNRSGARVMICESTDRGRTWSQKRPLTEKGTPNAYYNCAQISQVGNRLAIVCDFIEGKNEDNARVRNHLWFSDDDGATWSGPVITPSDGIVPDKLRQLKNGRWIITSHYMNHATGYLEQFLHYSDDEGKTWSERVTVATDPHYNLCEGCILELPAGELVCYMRENSGKGYDCFKVISRDNGETWSEIHNVPLPGCHRPSAGFLNDGDIFITYRFLQGGGGEFGSYTQNLFGALLPGESALLTDRKDQACILPIDHDRARRADIGYSNWVQFDDGEIYVVNYLVDDAPKAQIRGYSLKKEDIRF